jgi:chromosome segregation ATPase
MDAISFVLGVKSAQLRSSQLRDLVYRGRRLARDNGEGTSQPEPEDEDEEKVRVRAQQRRPGFLRCLRTKSQKNGSFRERA